MVPGENALPGLQMATFLLHPHMAFPLWHLEREKESEKKKGREGGREREEGRKKRKRKEKKRIFLI